MDEMPKREWNIFVSGTTTGIQDIGVYTERVRDKSHSQERILTIPSSYRKVIEKIPDNPPALVITPGEIIEQNKLANEENNNESKNEGKEES